MNPLIAAYTDSDLIGKMIFLGLFFLSIISWLILAQKVLAFRAVRKQGRHLASHFQQSKNRPLSLEHKGDEHPFLDIYRQLKEQTLEILRKNQTGDAQALSTADIDLVGSSLSATISNHIKDLEKNLFILSTVVTLGPFLGLLGTVWGILTTFSELSQKGGGQTSEAVLSGLAMALGTTILGLLVAIPALIAYNYLKNTSREIQQEMESFASQALSSVELSYRRVE